MIGIGVLGTSGIAERRMIPAIRKEASFRYMGAAFSTRGEMGFGGTDEEFRPIRAGEAFRWLERSVDRQTINRILHRNVNRILNSVQV